MGRSSGLLGRQGAPESRLGCAAQLVTLAAAAAWSLPPAPAPPLRSLPATVQRVEARTCAEFRAALQDTATEHILLMPRGPGEPAWNCTADDIPPLTGEMRNRTMIVEGAGPTPVYYNVGAAAYWGAVEVGPLSWAHTLLQQAAAQPPQAA